MHLHMSQSSATFNRTTHMLEPGRPGQGAPGPRPSLSASSAQAASGLSKTDIAGQTNSSSVFRPIRLHLGLDSTVMSYFKTILTTRDGFCWPMFFEHTALTCSQRTLTLYAQKV